MLLEGMTCQSGTLRWFSALVGKNGNSMPNMNEQSVEKFSTKSGQEVLCDTSDTSEARTYTPRGKRSQNGQDEYKMRKNTGISPKR